MKAKKYIAWLLTLCLLTGCAAQTAQETGEPQAEQTEQTTQETQSNTSAVADASQMTTVENVGSDGMTPVSAAELVDGVYNINVESSSSMFKITDCELTVGGEAMMAKLIMSSDSYGYLYLGTAEQAADADAADYIAPEVENGVGTFVFPLAALDQQIDCAAWSRNKELWYDRTLVFRADSLPLEAFQTLTTAESLGLTEGVYQVDVTLAGGSGKASVQSPAKLIVESGRVTAEIVWSSPNYDAMLANGLPYAPVNTEGNSTFLLDVLAFDRPIAVKAETVAMSQPHWIDYTLIFDSRSIVAVEP